MILEEAIRDELIKVYEKLTREGQILAHTQLDVYYGNFRQRFGPDRLANLDGEELLNSMHDISNHDSLAYWLEFKNDEELPARFGSIGGGSALKFGIYKRRETGLWTIGSPSQQKEIVLKEAIQIAIGHRDQLLRGVKLLDALPRIATDMEYARLQDDLDEESPDISNASWGHKYFHLLFPDKLEDFHRGHYQRFHLIKILQLPVSDKGRYTVAGQYMRISKELGYHINNFTRMLTERNGQPYNYWRIGTRSGDTHNSGWGQMRNEGFVAIGWTLLGDLSWVRYNQESKDRLKKEIKEKYRDQDPGGLGRNTQKVFNFVAAIEDGDLVAATDGIKVLGIARVNGGYIHNASSDWPHRRPVEWLKVGDWNFPDREGIRFAVHKLANYQNRLEIERKILSGDGAPGVETKPLPARLSGIPGRIQNILDRKQQVILYGPPGTGKTYWALESAKQLAAISTFGVPFEKLSEEQKRKIRGSGKDDLGLVRICTFHPSYGYEDFIEGYRPIVLDGSLAFQRRDGIFKKLCDDARQSPALSFFLVIDEINRGDIPRIFGEILTLLEKDKREQKILLPISQDVFSIPKNVFVLGTMNTADRSIALLDTALRRRFGFIELMPDISLLGDTLIKDIPLGSWLKELNKRILSSIGRDARNLQIGHAYFLENGHPVNEFGNFARILQDDILPLLEEYCYEDFAALEKVLGTGFINRETQSLRYELFDPKHAEDLIQAIKTPFAEIMSSSEATKVSVLDQEDIDKEGNEDEGVGN